MINRLEYERKSTQKLREQRNNKIRTIVTSRASDNFWRNGRNIKDAQAPQSVDVHAVYCFSTHAVPIAARSERDDNLANKAAYICNRTQPKCSKRLQSGKDKL